MSAIIWVVIGAAVLAACFSNKKGRTADSADGRRETLRIDRPHYYDADDYECSACGARFRKKSMVCPRCGARFDGSKEDETEFEEEMLEEEDWEE